MLPQERRSRGLFRGENRLYSLLTRSRSRSRSEQPKMDKPRQPATGSKPPTRIPSRPISSTTTATNATVTPATPKQKKRLPPLPTPPPSSRPTTPKSSAARQKLHNLFDLALGRKSTSRSRSRSRPSSPQLDPPVDLPPLPSSSTHNLANDTTPRPRRSLDSNRSASPTPKPLRVMNPTTDSTGTTSTTHSIRMPRFLSGRQSPTPDTRSLKSNNGGPPSLPPIPSLFSHQIKRVSSLHRRSKATDADSLTPVLQRKQSSDDSAIPRITHTPATPLKNGKGSGDVPGSSRTGNTGARMIYHAMKGSLDSSYRYRATTQMGGIDEEELPSKNKKGKGRETPSSPLPSTTSANDHHPAVSPTPIPRVGQMMSTATRATKHGSFDFERPGWSASIIQRSGSNGTTGTGGTATTASGWSRVLDQANTIIGTTKERDSTYGPGLAGVGTLQRDMSVKRGHERDEAMRARERAKKHALEVAKDTKDRDRDRDRPLPQQPPHSSSQRTTPSASDHAYGSTSTHGTGKSSSMGKATGRKALHASKTLSGVSGSGGAGLGSISIARHGLFAFEPPVASPTRSTGSTGTVHDSGLGVGGVPRVAEKEKERLQLEKEKMTAKQKDRLKGGGGVSVYRSGDRPAVPVPKPSATVPGTTAPTHQPGFGYRSGTKGRSLDLGLGLAWAPSKVREEALLPASGFFQRSLSNGSSVAGSRSGSSSSSNHHSTAVHTSGNGNERTTATVRIDTRPEVERSKLGKEVAEVFKKALKPSDYDTFRTYVHQFDRHEIPFDGPTGIVTLVEHLLSSSNLKPDARQRVLDKFLRVILQQA